MVELSVVVPVYNGEACLEELAQQVEAMAARWGRSHELVLVDDLSTDGSWAIIEGLCARRGRVVGIRLRKNAGQDNAILCGLRHATGRFVAVMDDDLQHSPSDVPSLVEACEARSWDVCYARFGRKRQAVWKNAGSWLNDCLANVVLDKPKALYLSPFKVLRREIVDEVVKYTGAFPYVDGLILSVTHAVGQIPVEHHDRYRGASQYSVAKSLLVFMRVATGFSVWPLRFSACVGSAFAFGGFALALFYFAQYLFRGHHVEGWVTLVILLLLIGGALLISLGMVGEYLGRLYLNSNGKPQVTIKELCRSAQPGGDDE